MDTSAVETPNTTDPENAPYGSGPSSDSPGAKRAILSLELAGPAGNGGKGPEEIASSAITEAGGALVRVSSTSLLSSFTTCGEALTAAVNIQQRFLLINQENRGQVEGRIGIHFGQFPENGDEALLAGYASRIARMAAASQIFVSEQVYWRLRDTPQIRFEPANIRHKSYAADGSTIYTAIWDKLTDLSQSASVVLYFRPLFNFGDSALPVIWGLLAGKEKAYWGGGVLRAEMLSDSAFCLTLKDGRTALGTVRAVLAFLKDELGKDKGGVLLPLNSFIHVYHHAGMGAPVIDGGFFPSTGVIPGNVYISAEAHRFVTSQVKIPIASDQGSKVLSSWHRVEMTTAGDGEDVESMFLHREALAAGKGSPCFYCGSRRHVPTDCPSKHLPEETGGLDRLGYLSIKELGDLFLRFLSEEITDPLRFLRDLREGRTEGLSPAFYGFYDLHRIFQPPFFRVVWRAAHEDWGKTVRSGWKGRSEGGLQWLAQDALRVSDLARAELILKEAQAARPHDYRGYCAQGYLHVERGDLGEAEYFFRKALFYAKSNTVRIFIHFLLFRLDCLLGRAETAYRNLGRILALDSWCAEAMYQDILFRFRQGNGKAALKKLATLISYERQYFVQALIDPDMAPFQTEVNELLGRVLSKAKADAESAVQVADEELARSSFLLTTKETEEAARSRAEMEALRKTGSYFGFIDAVHCGNTITSLCRTAKETQKREALKLLRRMSLRAKEDTAFALAYAFPNLIRPYHERLERIRDGITALAGAPAPSSRKEFEAAALAGEQLAAGLNRIETELSRLEVVQQLFLNGFRFMKNSLILITIVLVIGICLFPMAVYYFGHVLFKVDAASVPDIVHYQKSFIVLGGIASIIVSLSKTMRDLFRKERRTPR